MHQAERHCQRQIVVSRVDGETSMDWSLTMEILGESGTLNVIHIGHDDVLLDWRAAGTGLAS